MFLTFNTLIYTFIYLLYTLHIYTIYSESGDPLLGSTTKTLKFHELCEKYNINKSNIEIYRLINIHLIYTIQGSAYNWVRPSIWTAVFGGRGGTKKISGSGQQAVLMSGNGSSGGGGGKIPIISVMK